MGRFGIDDVDNYGSSGNSSFFSLKDDGDTAKVRFMYNGASDIGGYAVHDVTLDDDKHRNVSCLRSYNEPKSNCPFCAANINQLVKFYVPVYDVEDEEVKIWERGKKFAPKISALCARYSSASTPLVSHTFDIERHGKKGDTQTTYEIYETGADDTRLEDLPEIPDILGGIILEKTAAEMEYYLDNNCFPEAGGAKKDSRDDDRPAGRRTPSRRGSNF